MIKIGTNRWEAIDWVQDKLGPVTPRNIAEDTLQSLREEGLIDAHLDEVYLLEDLNQDDLRRRARNTMVTKDLRRMRRGPRRIGQGDRRIHRLTEHVHHEHHHIHTMQQFSDVIAQALEQEQEAQAPTTTKPRRPRSPR